MYYIIVSFYRYANLKMIVYSLIRINILYNMMLFFYSDGALMSFLGVSHYVLLAPQNGNSED